MAFVSTSPHTQRKAHMHCQTRSFARPNLVRTTAVCCTVGTRHNWSLVVLPQALVPSSGASGGGVVVVVGPKRRGRRRLDRLSPPKRRGRGRIEGSGWSNVQKTQQKTENTGLVSCFSSLPLPKSCVLMVFHAPFLHLPRTPWMGHQRLFERQCLRVPTPFPPNALLPFEPLPGRLMEIMALPHLSPFVLQEEGAWAGDPSAPTF